MADYDVKVVKRLILLLVPLCAVAQDARLAAVRNTVLGMRKYADDHSEVRGGIPQVTTAKHQLIQWIESQLASFPQNGNTDTLTETLHQGLTGAKLFCNNDVDCLPTALGFVDEIQITRQGPYLIAETAVGVGIHCGYDYSAYIYEWKNAKWQHIWENEQDDYSPKTYRPQILHSVQISDPTPDGSRLILTLGSQTGCLTFRDVYFRVWRLGTAQPLLDNTDLLYDEGDPPAVATLKPDDLRVEFSAGGGEYGFPHKAVRHFEIHGTTVKQVDPIGPTPRDFVDEWLAAAWTNAGPLSEAPSLEDWHKKLHRDDAPGDFPDDPKSCANDAELWQIATHLQDEPTHYFLVRWHRPDRFTMVQVADQPIDICK
jgi:hypothetical protein